MPQQDQRSARQRLLDAADELFYAEGVHTVGIDRVIERAGVAKASLYNTFGSKEALVGAYLDARRASTTDRLTAAVSTTTDPRGQVLAVFDAQERLFDRPGFRGCAFAAATSESPLGGVADLAAADYRSWVRAFFLDLATRFGARDPGLLAGQLHLLYDGAILSARMDREPAVARTARAAAVQLLDSTPVETGRPA